jgi:PAS domain S-box-containing protein
LIFQPVFSNGKKVGTVFLNVDLSVLNSKIKIYILASTIIILSIIALTFLFSSKLQKIISQPFLDLAKFAGSISRAKDYSSKASKGLTGSEIRILIDDINKMFNKLQQNKQDLKKQVAVKTLEFKKANDHLKKTAIALKVNKAKFRAITHMAPYPLVLLDWDGKVEYWNPAAEKMFGYSSKEILNKDLNQTLAPAAELHDDFEGTLMGLRKNQQNHFLEKSTKFTGIRKDGKEIPVEVSLSMVKIFDKPFFIGIIRDASTKKLIVEEQIKSQRLESIGLLAGGIAHDFNNILTGMLGNISLAKMNMDKGDKSYERLTKSERSCYKAKDLTQQLLTFSRGGSPIKKVVNIQKLVQEATTFVLRGSNIKCEFDIGEDLWASEIDEGQVNQVFQNLILNAKHAMVLGGTITVSIHNIVIPPGVVPNIAPGNYVKITIVDQGVGMSPNILEKIFDPYFTTKEKGTGLGLSICFSIVKRHGGLITADSKPGEGSTFRIYLPAVEKIFEKKEEVEIQDIKGHGRILVMDDDDVIREVVEDMLTSFGYQVTLTPDGHTAVEKYREEKEKGTPYDLVILDLTIPGGMGGEEAAAEILHIDSDAKLVVASGYANDPIMSNFKNYGFSEVVVKPFDAVKLGNVIKRALK